MSVLPPLPPAPHLPGRTPRPPEALFAALTEAVPEGPGALLAPAFAAGREAFARRYYWEAHELWEAVWMALPPASAEKLALRGLIGLANAGLKGRMDRGAAAARILARAEAELTEAASRGAALPGLDGAALAAMRAQAADDSSNDAL
ncbi:DUF309 domain-containing protein [Rhodovulum sp. DZ06]|uniref:DUF309 domain-containing protein n=1 Tax=Rhodovulum sp. DZ06 TaxID=3425126 RepID=UPI003D351883